MKKVRISLWQDWRFRLIWIGQTASIFGDRVTGIALPWLLLRLHLPPWQVGLVFGAAGVGGLCWNP